MGLLASGDEDYQGWLATLLGCCAAEREDEDSDDKCNVRSGATPPVVCYDQPIVTKSMISRPLLVAHPTASSLGADCDDYDHVRSCSERPPSLKPLDLGETPFFSRTSLPGLNRSSCRTPRRVSIEAPTALPRLELTDHQRASLVPLQLEPVVMRDSVVRSLGEKPVAGHELSRSKSEDSLTGLYQTTPPQCQARELSITSSSSPAPLSSNSSFSTASPRMRTLARTPLSSRSSSSSMRSLSRYPISAPSNTSSPQSRHSLDWSRLTRKRAHTTHKSSLSFENVSTSGTIEREILELNTIVEERRAEGLSSHPPKHTQHISAVAPSLSIRARSQTLTDIGSAFSRPLPVTTENSPQLPWITSSESTTDISPVKQRLSRPFTNMPDLFAILPANATTSEPTPKSSLINGWLSSLLARKSDSARTAPPMRDTSYSRAPPIFHRSRAVSAISATSTASSACSTNHSRSVTAYSATTPASSPPSSTRREWKSGQVTILPVEPLSPTKVGLAF